MKRIVLMVFATIAVLSSAIAEPGGGGIGTKPISLQEGGGGTGGIMDGGMGSAGGVSDGGAGSGGGIADGGATSSGGGIADGGASSSGGNRS